MQKLVLLISLGSNVAFSFLFPIDGQLAHRLATNTSSNAGIDDATSAVNTTANHDDEDKDKKDNGVALGTSFTPTATPTPAGENITEDSADSGVSVSDEDMNDKAAAKTEPENTQSADETAQAPEKETSAADHASDNPTEHASTDAQVTLPVVNVSAIGVSLHMGL